MQGALKIQIDYYKYFAVLLLFIIFSNKLTFAQRFTNPQSKFAEKDTTINTKKDSNASFIKKLNVTSDGIKEPVNYKAQDSIVFDAATKQFYLYNKAEIKYEDLILNADFINYSIDSNLLNAKPNMVGPIADTANKPSFKQGEQNFTFDSLRYNFKTQKAFVEEAHTQYGEGYLISEKVKRNNDKSISGYKNIYTTCNADTPHFGIYCNRIKVIPNVVGISGPAHLVIEEIPTPLYLPFALFPLRKDQSAGFILPQYNFRASQGFALTGGGYYLPINDYVDFTLKGDIYTLGGWGIGANSNYNKKYNYSGGIGFTYGRVILQSDGAFNARSNTFSLTWNHRIDPKKLQNANFSATVNLGSSNINKLTINRDVRSNLNNTLRSTITYGKNWGNGKYNLTATLGHEQNTNTREFNLTLPNINFSIPNITPFANKKIIGKPKWYNKIVFNYSADLQNNLRFYDSAFSINKINATNFRNGMLQRVSGSFNNTLLKYFTFTINGNYNEYWLPTRNTQFYNFAENRVDTIVQRSLFTSRDLSAGASLNTQIFGTLLFKKGKIKGIRHRINPAVGFSMAPSFGNKFWGNYYDAIIDSNNKTRRLSYWNGNIFSGPNPDKRNGSISFSIDNTLEAKIRNNKDTVNGFKKVRYFDRFNFNTSYDIAADSFNWAPLRWSATTTIANLTFNANADWNFYGIDYETGNTVSEYAYQKNKKFARFRTASISGGKQFNFNNNTAKDTIYKINIPFSLGINAAIDLNKIYNKRKKSDSLAITARTSLTGNLKLTTNWNLDLNTNINYNGKKFDLETTTININRDLHCWQMSFGITPYGYYKGYTFSLSPKGQLLKDLRVNRQRTFLDNQ